MSSATLPRIAPLWLRDERQCEWRGAEDAVRRAYAAWQVAAARERSDAFAAYRAALDREQAACDALARPPGLRRRSARSPL